MRFNEVDKQWISEGADLSFGESLRVELLKRGVEVIPAGTVMVFAWKGKSYLMFQTLRDLSLDSAKNTTLLYYEKGSIVYTHDEERVEVIPTLRFRDCRMPTEFEYLRYERRATI